MEFETRTGKSEHGVCSFCGADKVLNKKTGKIFCSEKCFLKSMPNAQNGGTVPQQQQSNTNIPLDQFVTKTELNNTLDKMRLAFRTIQLEIRDLSSRLGVAEQALDEIVSGKDLYKNIPVISSEKI